MKINIRKTLILCVVFVAICLSACGKNTDTISADAYKSLFLNYDYGDNVVYTIGHKSPDSDTVMAAIGLSEYLNAIGIKAEPRIAGTMNSETQYAVSSSGIIEPQILTEVKGSNLFLVDHSDYAQAIEGASEANIVGIIDHHGIGSVSNSQMINVISAPVGSTCSLIYRLFVESGIDISKDAADALITGLLSDTKNMTVNTTQLDVEAFEQLKKYTSIKDTDSYFDEMYAAKYNYYGLDDTQIFYSDYKDYEYEGIKYGMGVAEVGSVSQIDEYKDRMMKVMDENLDASGSDFITLEIYDSNYEMGYFLFKGKDIEDTYELMQEAFGSIGEVHEDYVLFTPSRNRKKQLVPEINNAIHARLYGLSE